MKTLLVIKSQIKKFVGKNDVFIEPLLRFLLTYMVLLQINGKFGYMTRLASAPVTLIIALAGSFLPVNLTICILAAVTVAHLYKLSLEVAIVVLALFIILFLLYYRFASQDAIAVLITPLAFVFKVPYVMPIAMGLKGTPTSMVSVGTSVIVYNVLHFISENAEDLKGGGTAISITTFRAVVDSIIGNRNMMVMAVAFAATVLVVYFIRRLPINYCWLIAIVAGVFTLLIATIIGNGILSGNVSVGATFIGAIVSALFNLVLWYFCFDLDYQKVEKVQFEDDEYYYYVKAVPKNDIITESKKKPEYRPSYYGAPKASAPAAATSTPTRTVAREKVAEPVARPAATARPRSASPSISRAEDLSTTRVMPTATTGSIKQNSIGRQTIKAKPVTTMVLEDDLEDILILEDDDMTVTSVKSGIKGSMGNTDKAREEAARRAEAERIARARAQRNR